jgi:hypothetical protein
MTVFFLTSNAEEDDLNVQYKGAASVRPNEVCNTVTRGVILIPSCGLGPVDRLVVP